MYLGTGLVRFSQRVVTCLGCLAALSCGDDEVGPPSGWAGSGGGFAGQAGGVGGAGMSAAGSGGTSGRGDAGRGGISGASGAGRGGAGRSGAGSGGTISPPPVSTGTYAARDGALFDSCGEKVVLRGVNHPTIYVDRQGAALPEIAKTGANSVRLFWYARNNVQIGEAEASISRAIELGMIPILELHDSTCAWNLDGIVNYWTSPQAIQLIQKYQSHLIVNVANEPSPPSATEFRTKYTSIIQRMRQAGIRTPLMIDGGNCGRDYQVILAQGPALVEADPDHNLIFSAHLYNRMSQANYAKVFTDMLAKDLTFVVGEFAHKSPPGCGGTLDYGALISEAQTNGIGWLAWSWGDNNPGSDWNEDCGEFDMTSTFSFDSLRGWGRDVALDLPASIKNTSKRPASLSRACSN